MSSFWHPDFTFSDPAFPNLTGARAKAMFHMFITNRETSKMKVTITSPAAAVAGGPADTYSASYNCDYLFGESSVPVHNEINCVIELKDGKVWKQSDDFHLGNWAKQSLGSVMRHTLGISGILGMVVRKKATERLDFWCKKHQQFHGKE